MRSGRDRSRIAFLLSIHSTRRRRRRALRALRRRRSSRRSTARTCGRWRRSSSEFRQGRWEFLVKWKDWNESYNSWEPTFHINRADINAFMGKPTRQPKRKRSGVPVLPHRGAGCARARLSTADQRRGGVPQSMSMVCGNVLVDFTERVDESSMPTLTLTFYVLTMDKTGHIVWPSDWRLRRQCSDSRSPECTSSIMEPGVANREGKGATKRAESHSPELWESANHKVLNIPKTVAPCKVVS